MSDYLNIYVLRLEPLAMLVNDPLKRNNPINIFLINLNIILYHPLSLNIYDYLECHQRQYYDD